MYPYITLFGKTIASYGTMACIGALAAGILLYFLTRKDNFFIDDIILFFLFVGAGVVLGGHLLYGITNMDKLKELSSVTNLAQLRTVLAEVFGGAVFYGGLIGGTVFGIIGTRILRLDTCLYSDGMAVATPLFHFFGRIGCFFAGCCYGIESDVGFVLHGVCRFPVQLLEAGANLLICGIILTLYFHGKMKGRLFFIYLAIYAAVRFFDEFLRGDLIRGFIFGLSTSQFISIFVEAFAIGALLYLQVKGNRSKATAKCAAR